MLFKLIVINLMKMNFIHYYTGLR